MSFSIDGKEKRRGFFRFYSGGFVKEVYGVEIEFKIEILIRREYLFGDFSGCGMFRKLVVV